MKHDKLADGLASLALAHATLEGRADRATARLESHDCRIGGLAEAVSRIDTTLAAHDDYNLNLHCRITDLEAIANLGEKPSSPQPNTLDAVVLRLDQLFVALLVASLPVSFMAVMVIVYLVRH